MNYSVRRFVVPGTYRVHWHGECFGHIRRDGRKWLAEIRYRETGEVKRYAGIWPRLRDAVEECIHFAEHNDNPTGTPKPCELAQWEETQ